MCNALPGNLSSSVGSEIVLEWLLIGAHWPMKTIWWSQVTCADPRHEQKPLHSWHWCPALPHSQSNSKALNQAWGVHSPKGLCRSGFRLIARPSFTVTVSTFNLFFNRSPLQKTERSFKDHTAQFPRGRPCRKWEIL